MPRARIMRVESVDAAAARRFPWSAAPPLPFWSRRRLGRLLVLRRHDRDVATLLLDDSHVPRPLLEPVLERHVAADVAARDERVVVPDRRGELPPVQDLARTPGDRRAELD